MPSISQMGDWIIALTHAFGFDELDQFADGFNLIGQFDLAVQLIFQIHQQFHSIQGVDGQLLERILCIDLGCGAVNALCNHLCDSLKNHNSLPPTIR